MRLNPRKSRVEVRTLLAVTVQKQALLVTPRPAEHPLMVILPVVLPLMTFINLLDV